MSELKPYSKSQQVGRKSKRAKVRLKRSRMKRSRKPLKSKGGPPRDTERMKFVGSLPCVACFVTGSKQMTRTHADHIRSRGAGGKEAGNLWPLCAKHHDERHMHGLQTFCAMYNLDRQRIAADVEKLFVVQLARAA